jgi:murein DD-endopeptidase MepM/ murein hydrolase activator NlpD
MVAETSGRGSKRFPDIQIIFRNATRSSQIALPPVLQMAAALAVIAVAAAFFYLGASHLRAGRLVADNEAAVIRAETANADLQDEVASLQDKLATAVRERDQAGRQLAALAGQIDTVRSLLSSAEAKLRSQPRGEIHQLSVTEEPTASKASRIEELTRALEQTQRELHQVDAQRATLAARLSKAAADRVGQQACPGRHRASLGEGAVDRDKAVSERDRLSAQIGELEQKHTWREMSPRNSAAVLRLAGFIVPEVAPFEADLPQPPLLITDAPPEPEPEHAADGAAELGRRGEGVITDAPPEPERGAGGIAELGRRGIGELERVLSSTGLDIGRLFSQFGLNRAEGGPFVPPPKSVPSTGLSPDKLDAIRALIKSLPLSAPLEYYQLESRFGPRRDPFNRRVSFHTGIDLSAPYTSPIYATAAGIVAYAGYFGDYGKVVVLDHGNGIATLYGHMHRYIVSVGQRVDAHTQIGLLGSSGRSSGPHVHYEVLVNGEPQDPEKFIGLGHLVPVTDK